MRGFHYSQSHPCNIVSEYYLLIFALDKRRVIQLFYDRWPVLPFRKKAYSLMLLVTLMALWQFECFLFTFYKQMLWMISSIRRVLQFIDSNYSLCYLVTFQSISSYFINSIDILPGSGDFPFSFVNSERILPRIFRSFYDCL